jgi:hypothetical protein
MVTVTGGEAEIDHLRLFSAGGVNAPEGDFARGVLRDSAALSSLDVRCAIAPPIH